MRESGRSHLESLLLLSSVASESAIFIGSVSVHAWLSAVVPAVCLVAVAESSLARHASASVALGSGVVLALLAAVLLRLQAGALDGSVGRAVAVSGAVAVLAFAFQVSERPWLGIIPQLTLMLLGVAVLVRVQLPGLSAAICSATGTGYLLVASTARGSRRAWWWLLPIATAAGLLLALVPLWVEPASGRQTWLLAPPSVADVAVVSPANVSSVGNANTAPVSAPSVTAAQQDDTQRPTSLLFLPVGRALSLVNAPNWWILLSLLVVGVVMSWLIYGLYRRARRHRMARELNRGSPERRLLGAWLWVLRTQRSQEKFKSPVSEEFDELRQQVTHLLFGSSPAVSASDADAWWTATRGPRRLRMSGR